MANGIGTEAPRPLWYLGEIADALDCKEAVLEERKKDAVFSVHMDSRELRKNSLFIAIHGDRMDGHSFLMKAYEAGAIAAIVDHIPEDAPKEMVYFKVGDSLEGMRSLARAARARLNGPVIGITGSVGKTGTRALMSTALTAFGGVHASQGSFNNHWGVPFSLALTPEQADFSVFEIGMNHGGEITPLTQLVQPDIAIITRIAEVHIENFEGIEDIAAAKSEIFNGVKRGGYAIINADDGFDDFLKARAVERGLKTRVFGESEMADARLLDYKLVNGSGHVRAEVLGKEIAFSLKIPGKHIAMNSMAVLLALDVLGLDSAKGAAVLETLAPLEGRGAQSVITLEGGIEATLIDESYNASPISMEAAFQVLSSFETTGRRIAILGDMFELGDQSEAYHKGLVDPIVKSGVDAVYCCGKLMKNLHDALPSALAAGHSETLEDAMKWTYENVASQDVVLIKGSNGMRLSQIVKALKQ